MLQIEKTFVLMTMLSFLIENQALEWQDRSEEDGTLFLFPSNFADLKDNT